VDRVTVWGLNFRTRPDRPKRPTQPPMQWVPDLFLWVKQPGDRVVNAPILAPKLKKGYNYTSTPPLELRSCCRMNFTLLYLYITGLFNDNFKRRNCPFTRRASAANSIESDTAVLNGRSVPDNYLLLSGTFTR